MQRRRLAGLLLEAFFHEELERHAVAVLQGEDLAYQPIQTSATEELLVSHLDGNVSVGAYQLNEESKVKWLAWDVDAAENRKQARHIADQICDVLGEIPYGVEFSGSKGYHIIVLLDKLYPASEVKEVCDQVRVAVGAPKVGDPHVDVFPRQGKLRGKGYGSLLKVPFGVHPKTGERSRLVDRNGDWEDGPEIDPTPFLRQRVSLSHVLDTMREQTPEESIVNLLVPHRKPGQGHDLILFLAGFLANMGWEKSRTLELVEQFCDATGDEEITNRLQAVEDTYRNRADGKRVAGMDALGEYLPQAVLKDLARLAGAVQTSHHVTMVDEIRLDKGPSFLKVRSTGMLVNNFLNENGRTIMSDGEMLWLNDDSKELIPFEGDEFYRFLHLQFGINPEESFGKQVWIEIYNRSYQGADRVKAFRRSYWDGDTLWLSLGGKEVYEINGTGAPRIHYNGETDVVFRNGEDPLTIPNLKALKPDPVDPWGFLVDDVSFATSEDASATPREQAELAKAWILSSFFPQLMPTRPILTLLGGAGSGKTTTARRMLKLLEGPREEVLGLVVDKPDSLRTSFTRHKYVVLDNLERTKAPWLSDMLNRIATGTDIEIRELYTTNRMRKIRPDVFPVLTAIEMPFSDEALFSRLLPVELDQLTRPKPEYIMQKQLLDNMFGMWAGMVEYLDQVTSTLLSNTVFMPPTTSRLADFGSFCARVQDCEALSGEDLMSGIMALGNRQRKVLGESSPLVSVLEHFLRHNRSEVETWHSAGELNRVLMGFAAKNKLPWRWNSPQGFARHLDTLKDTLERDFGLVVRETYDSSQGRKARRYRFEPHTVDLTVERTLH